MLRNMFTLVWLWTCPAASAMRFGRLTCFRLKPLFLQGAIDERAELIVCRWAFRFANINNQRWTVDALHMGSWMGDPAVWW